MQADMGRRSGPTQNLDASLAHTYVYLCRRRLVTSRHVWRARLFLKEQLTYLDERSHTGGQVDGAL